MDYHEYANELIEYMIVNEQIGRKIQGKISELAKGEDAVLLYLSREKNGVSAIEISQRFDINTSRVAAILNNLCKKGFIERQSDPHDKRKIQVFITERGKEYVLTIHKEITTRVIELLQVLGEDDTKEYIRITKRLTTVFKELSNHENVIL